MSRTEFSAKVKVAAFERAKGLCEICTRKLYTGDINYDHRIPDQSGGDASLDNCQVLCRACHGTKTSKSDIPSIAKGRRIRRRNAGIRKPSSFRGWRKLSGEVVYARDRER
jgi:5-methylcytosine-specific restriction protein A